ncbi:MAG: VTT domain-containing protein [Ignavibacteriales bacterium]|nr:VTT domain-containing protein [Ignavibacteriales bacterium]
MDQQTNAVHIKESRKIRLESLIVGVALVLLFVLFTKSGLREQVSRENLHELGANPFSPIIIIAAMAGAWTFALPASVFFFITPLLFPPLAATGIICAGSAAGSTMGYVAARFGGSPWFQRFNNSRVTRFLSRHSTFSALFTIRVFPSSPHMFINYGAGLLNIPFTKFILATLLGIGIKAFLYSTAIEGSVGASSMQEALNWQTVSALMALTGLGIAGHVMQRRWKKEEEKA